MNMQQAVLLCSSIILAAVAADPTPPCAPPPGIVAPAVPESMCYDEIVPVSKTTGITIRRYGFPANATFVSGIGQGAYVSGVQSSIATVANYFAGANDEQRPIPTARTVPFAITPPRAASRAYYWTAYLEVSPVQFPDNFLIPRPNPGTGVALSLVSSNIDLVAAFQFNTTGLPYEENFLEACGAVQNSTLPSGYAINTTSPFSPTYVFYNGQASANFTNECWMAVYKV